MKVRWATWEDIKRFECSPAICGEFALDYPVGSLHLALWMTFIRVPLQVIEHRGIPLLVYGTDGRDFTLFPSAHIHEHPVAFARATFKAYAAHRGSGLKCKVRKTETRVIRWARWLGVQMTPCSDSHLEVTL